MGSIMQEALNTTAKGQEITLLRCDRSVRVGPLAPDAIAAVRSVAAIAIRTPAGRICLAPAPVPLSKDKDQPERRFIFFPAGRGPRVHPVPLPAAYPWPL